MRIKFEPIDAENDYLLELFGTIIGDGCIVHYKRHDANDKFYNRIFITGNATKNFDYWSNYLMRLLSKLGISAYLHVRKATNPLNANTIDLIINNQPFTRFLIDLGFPVGKKKNIAIPEWIIKLPLKKKLKVIRGIFDTDGCLSARKSENYRRPMVLISSHSSLLRYQIKTILREAGFPAYDSTHMVGIVGIKNAKKWFEIVGSSNKRNLSRYECWLKTGRVPFANAIETN